MGTAIRVVGTGVYGAKADHVDLKAEGWDGVKGSDTGIGPPPAAAAAIAAAATAAGEGVLDVELEVEVGGGLRLAGRGIMMGVGMDEEMECEGDALDDPANFGRFDDFDDFGGED